MSATGIHLRIARVPLLGSVLLKAYRLKGAIEFLPLRELWRWLYTSRETTNYTYDLTPQNKDCLAYLLGEITGQGFDALRGFIRELDEDQELKGYLRERILSQDDRYFRDAEPHYARRFAWYALVRAKKPKVVVETGCERGLGTCVLTAALRRNAAEGHPGYYHGFDISRTAGSLFGGPYAAFGRIVIGDAIAHLSEFEEPIDVFVSEVYNADEYEAAEIEVAGPRMAPDGVMFSRNLHLLDFARRSGRKFAYGRELTVNHFYSGANIGIVYGPPSERGGDLQ